MILSSTKLQIRWMEAHVKRHRLKEIALVGAKDTLLLRQLLLNFRPSIVHLVFPMQEGLRPRDDAQQRLHFNTISALLRANSARLTTDFGTVAKAAERVDKDFDCVILWDAIAPSDFGQAGAAWSPKVRDNGWLMGLDYRSPEVIRVLQQVSHPWKRFTQGIWGIQVKRPEEPVEEVVEELKPVRRRRRKAETEDVGA